jgi:hypothetical protein
MQENAEVLEDGRVRFLERCRDQNVRPKARKPARASR